MLPAHERRSIAAETEHPRQRQPWPRSLDAAGVGQLLTADEVAVLLGVSKEWVWQESRAGRIPTITLGRYRRYRAEAIRDWLRSVESGKIASDNTNGRAAR